MNKTVFVTGATGFIGGAVTRRLHAMGARPIALERTPGKGDALREMDITVVKGDITDHARIRAIRTEYEPDIIMHIAAWLSGKPFSNFEAVNVAATRNLAEGFAGRFVYTSSVMVYGGFGDENVTEDRPLEPYGDPYGDSKIRSERVLRAVKPEAVIIRPGMVYGPGSRGWTLRPIAWAKAGRAPLIDGGRGTAYPVYIDNLVDLLLVAATHPAAPGETFNGVDDGPVTMADFYGGYMAMVPTNKALRLPGWLAAGAAALINPFLPDYNYRVLVDHVRGRGIVKNERAKAVLSWQPRVSLEEGLRRSEAWLRAIGKL